jgi:hypothetical protein
MTHEDAGKYGAKHPPSITLNEQIAKAIQEKSAGGALACEMAEKISKDLEVKISEVGITADLLEIKIIKCQLGLFGWGEKPNHGKDIQVADSISLEMKSAIQKAAKNGLITCATLWRIADRLGAKRNLVSTACDTLKIKIRACQLGTF